MGDDVALEVEAPTVVQVASPTPAPTTSEAGRESEGWRGSRTDPRGGGEGGCSVHPLAHRVHPVHFCCWRLLLLQEAARDEGSEAHRSGAGRDDGGIERRSYSSIIT